MIPSNRLVAGVVTTLVVLCYVSGKEARAQANSGRQTKAASRLARSQLKVENEKARQLVEDGLRRAEQKDWTAAFEAFNQALAINPRNGDVYIAMGDTYMDMGKYKEGFNAYQQAIIVAPSNPEAHYSLGAAYNDMAQYGDAFKHFVQAIRLNPNFAEAHYGIGYAYLKIDRFRDAISYLRRAVQLWPDSAEFHLTLGQAYIGLRDVNAAEKEIKILARLDASAASSLEKELSAKLNESALPPGNKSVVQQTAQEAIPDSAARPVTKTQSSSVGLNPRPTVPRNDADLAVELSFWESVKNSTIPEEFAAYLKKYPEGQFAELARIRMRSLTEVSRPDSSPKLTSKTEAGNGDQPPTKEEPKEQPETSDAANANTIEATLESLRKLLPSTFSYQIRAAGSDIPVEIKVNYEPLKFEGCTVKWRDQNDTLSVLLSDLNPEAVKVEPRSKSDSTFSIEVWNLSISTVDGKEAIHEAKGDGSNTVNHYNGLDLQYDQREKAERLAGIFRQAIRLCRGKS